MKSWCGPLEIRKQRNRGKFTGWIQCEFSQEENACPEGRPCMTSGAGYSVVGRYDSFLKMAENYTMLVSFHPT